MILLAVTDATLTRLARRSWHTLAANSNEPMSYWEMIQEAIRREREGF